MSDMNEIKQLKLSIKILFEQFTRFHSNQVELEERFNELSKSHRELSGILARLKRKWQLEL